MPADDHDPVASLAAARRTTAPRDRRALRPGRATRGRAASRSPSSRGRRGGGACDDDRLRRRDVQDAAEARAGRDAASSSVRLAGCIPRRRMSSRERRHRQLLRDLRLAHERARAAAADEVALAHELVERRAHGQPRDAEVGARAAARTGSRRRRRAARSARAPGRGSRAASSLAAAISRAGAARRLGRRRQQRLAAVSDRRSGSRDGIDARARAARRRGARARGSTRAVKSARRLGQQRRLVRGRSTSAVIGGASTVKNTCASEPSSSSTSTSTVDRRRARRANAASSKPPAGCRATTRSRPGWPAGARSSGTRKPPNDDPVAVDRRLDEVHRRRADERRDEEVRAARA